MAGVSLTGDSAGLLPGDQPFAAVPTLAAAYDPSAQGGPGVDDPEMPTAAAAADQAALIGIALRL